MAIGGNPARPPGAQNPVRTTYALRRLLLSRLRLVRPWVDDRRSVLSWIRPGRQIVVDIRDEWLDSELALLLYSLMVQALVLNPARQDSAVGAVPLMVIVDEGHKLVRDKVVRRQLGGMIRERRHLGLRVVVASQDPQSLPQDILALLDGVGVYQHASQEWNRCRARAIDDFGVLHTGHTANLPPGVMWFWAKSWHMLEGWAGDWRRRLHLIDTRPRLSQHGGHTRRAV